MSELYLKDTGVTRRGLAVFELTRPLVYRFDGATESKFGGVRLRVIVPTGFRTDFASIPRVFWRLYNPSGAWRAAAVVHDYLYSREAECPRFLADAIFRHLMEHQCRWWQRLPIYYAVRIFGRRAYRGGR